MPVSAFPALTVIEPDYFDELEPEAPVTKSPNFGDGGADFNVDADAETRRFVLRYTVLSDAQDATILAHVRTAKYNPDVGSGYAFNFTTRAGETVLVRYDRGGYKRSHENKDCNTVEVLLIHYP